MQTEVLCLEFSTKTNVRTIEPEGRHYKGVIGKQYSVLKSFMIRKNINGPSWLRVRGVRAENDSANPANFVIFRLPTEDAVSPVVNQSIPPVSVLALHAQKAKGRVVAVSLSILWPNQRVPSKAPPQNQRRRAAAKHRKT